MKNNIPELIVKIDNTNIFFIAGKYDEQDNFETLEKLILPIVGFDDNKITDLEKITDLIKKNILILEQKISFTFKNLIIILNNFDISFLNLSGFKKLNGTQISKENITYILNSLKSCVEEFENNKKIIHIFNSEYKLDKLKIDNLPIGLFGDFYSHELSMSLIKKNDLKNLENIFEACNLNIKKIFLNSFVEGSLTSENNPNVENFFQIQINDNRSKIFYFENGSLKFEQEFSFGTKIILKDIIKVTSLKLENVNLILDDLDIKNNIEEKKLLDKKYFLNDQNYRKIKEKLIHEIIEARIQELSNIILLENINLENLLKKANSIFLGISNELHQKAFRNFFENYLSKKKQTIKPIYNLDQENLAKCAVRISKFGWKKEAIPVPAHQKSIISRFFDAIFG
jgi:cell division protein FtsA